MMKLILLLIVGIAGTLAANAPVVPSAANYPHTQNSFDPYYRNNNPYYRNNDPYYRSGAYNGNDYYRNNQYYKNDYYKNPSFKNEFNTNNPYYKNDYYRNNAYDRNDYYRNNPYHNTNNPYSGNDYYRNNPFARNDHYNKYNNYTKYDPSVYSTNDYYRQHYAPGAEAGARILNFENNLGPDGSYQYGYNTENGISVAESGVARYIDPENSVENVQGYYQYTSPEGTPVHVRYTADENGYHPEVNGLSRNGYVNSGVIASQRSSVFPAPVSSTPVSSR